MSIRLNGSTSGYVEIDAPAVAGSTSITLPATSGGEVVVTDSSGDLNVDNGTFFVDASTNRVGIGTTSVSAGLHVVADINPVLKLDRGTANTTNANLYYNGTLTGQLAAVNADFRISAAGASTPMSFYVNGSQRAAIDTSGRLLVGTTTDIGQGQAQFKEHVHVFRTSNSTTAGQNVGLVSFGDARGGAFARIQALSDGTPGTDDYPGRLEFSTTSNSTSSPTTRVKIDRDGKVFLNTTNTAYQGITIEGAGYSGQDGSIRIKPNTIPGSGTSNFMTFFQGYNTGSGSTNHNVRVEGSLSKGSGSFRIPHPLKPETHELVHSFIEGPQADLIYRGHVQLVNGIAMVNIDEAGRMTEGTFEALCTNVCCFTSNESDWTAVRGSVSGNILTIEAQDPTSTAEICWMVIGERKDPHMIDTDWTDDNGRVITEPLKTEID